MSRNINLLFIIQCQFGIHREQQTCLGKAAYRSQDEESKDVKLKHAEALHGSTPSEVQQLLFA